MSFKRGGGNYHWNDGRGKKDIALGLRFLIFINLINKGVFKGHVILGRITKVKLFFLF